MQDASDCVMRLQRFEFGISWFKYHLMKSLILAQDERWRRA